MDSNFLSNRHISVCTLIVCILIYFCNKKVMLQEEKPGPSRDFEVERGESKLWVDKYKPANVKSIIGQQGDKSNMAKLITWLKAWDKHHGPGATGKPPPRPPPWGAGSDNGHWAKAALLSGPPGVGKTTTSYLVAKELGYEVTELNASDTRSKKQLDSVVAGNGGATARRVFGRPLWQ